MLGIELCDTATNAGEKQDNARKSSPSPNPRTEAMCCASSQSWGFPAGQTLPIPTMVTPPGWPADAESCCGDTPADREEDMADLACWADGVSQYGQPPRQIDAQLATCAGHAASPPTAGQCGSCAHSGNSSMDSDGDCCGDDFEALRQEDASMLLEDVSNEYPGGVDAALADWAAACSSQEQQTASAGVPDAERGNTTLMLPAACWQQQQQPAAVAVTHKGALPSLAAVLLTQTQPQSLAAAMLPCCQWGAFDGDAVGEVLAGRAPAPSCATSMLHY